MRALLQTGMTSTKKDDGADNEKAATEAALKGARVAVGCCGHSLPFPGNLEPNRLLVRAYRFLGLLVARDGVVAVFLSFAH